MSDIAAFMYVSVEPTAGGASGDVDGIFDDEPMCMHTTVLGLGARLEERVPVAVGVVDRRQAEERRDLARSATAWPPRAALRRISARGELARPRAG